MWVYPCTDCFLNGLEVARIVDMDGFVMRVVVDKRRDNRGREKNRFKMCVCIGENR